MDVGGEELRLHCNKYEFVVKMWKCFGMRARVYNLARRRRCLGSLRIAVADMRKHNNLALTLNLAMDTGIEQRQCKARREGAD